MVNHNGVEEACSEHEVLPIDLLTRLGLDCGWSCEQVNGPQRVLIGTTLIRV